jgi:excisionase family DNA binding protein
VEQVQRIQPGVLSIPEAAEYLRVNRSFVYTLLDSGQLPSFHLGRRRLIRREDLDALVERQMAAEGGL